MPSYGQTVTLQYLAWDTSANTGKTGDAANHTLRWVKDGVSAVPTNTSSEVDGTNAPGVYKIIMTTAEASCQIGTICGKSSTANVVVLPLTVTFENLPTAAPASANGLPTNGTGTGQISLTGGGVNVYSIGGTIVYSSEGTLASATATSVTFPATDVAGNAIPNDTRYEYAVMEIVGGTGVGQIVLLTTKSGVNTFDVLAGTMPVACDGTSKYVMLGSWRSGITGSITTTLDTTQIIPLVNATNSVGECLIAGRAQAIGAWDYSTAGLGVIKNSDGSTLKSFTIGYDTNGKPVTRS